MVTIKTKHAPATPLPWQDWSPETTAVLDRSSYGVADYMAMLESQRIALCTECDALRADRRKLVEALRNALPILAQVAAQEVIAEGSADGYACKREHAARALLRSLGEDAS